MTGRALLAMAIAAGLPAATGRAEAPLSYLESYGSPGKAILEITWGLLALAIAVVVVVAVLVALGLARVRFGIDLRQDRAAVRRPAEAAPRRWIYAGLALTAVVLIGFTTWTVGILAAIQMPRDPSLTVEVTGHQWWWEIRYANDDDPSLVLETANEIHVPVGEPVRVVLTSADVIHSFWVPALAGKTDLIPGQTNVAWFEADTPGIFRGQCAEYCGLQHAHMALRVIAQTPEDFVAWWEGQLAPAADPAEPDAEIGQAAFVRHCSACHTVRGTIAGGEVGPDLTHLMSRTTIAAGMLPNTIGHLSGWIANPDALKPGTPMPTPDVSGPELEAIRSYLVTLL
jgi:cytochrome c oxidase subunit II